MQIKRAGANSPARSQRVDFLRGGTGLIPQPALSLFVSRFDALGKSADCREEEYRGGACLWVIFLSCSSSSSTA